MAASPARRRYNRSVLLLSASYALILFGVVGFFQNHPGHAGRAAYLIAALPALPIIGILFVLGRYIVAEADEYLRMLIVRQALIATGITLSLATVWGFLEDFGLVPHIYAFHAAVVWFAGFGVGAIANRIIERGWA